MVQDHLDYAGHGMVTETNQTVGSRYRYDFYQGETARDLGKPDPVWVDQGYARGVPMGGDLYVDGCLDSGLGGLPWTGQRTPRPFQSRAVL